MAFEKKRKESFVLILNTALFFLGAIDYYDKGDTTLFIVLIVTAISNFSMIFLGETYKSGLNIFLFFLNSMIAFLVARDYYFGGSDYIHFAWLVAGLVYLVATFVLFKRSRK